MSSDEHIIKYDRIKGVPQSHYVLMKIDQFGDFECPYQDRILYHSSSKEKLIDFCKEQNIKLKDPSGWNEYFITRNDRSGEEHPFEESERILKDAAGAIDFLVKHAKDKGWDCVQDACKILTNHFKKKNSNED